MDSSFAGDQDDKLNFSVTNEPESPTPSKRVTIEEIDDASKIVEDLKVEVNTRLDDLLKDITLEIDNVRQKFHERFNNFDDINTRLRRAHQGTNKLH